MSSYKVWLLLDKPVSIPESLVICVSLSSSRLLCFPFPKRTIFFFVSMETERERRRSCDRKEVVVVGGVEYKLSKSPTTTKTREKKRKQLQRKIQQKRTQRNIWSTNSHLNRVPTCLRKSNSLYFSCVFSVFSVCFCK